MASFGKRLKKAVKKVGRIQAKVFAKTVKVIAPVLSAVATVYTGPAGGMAVTGALAGASKYAGATAARAKGLKGRDARAKGRSLAKQVLKYGMLGTGVGAIGGAIATGSLTGALGGTSGLFGAIKPAAAPAQGPFGDFNPEVRGSQLSDVSNSNATTEYEHVGLDTSGQNRNYQPDPVTPAKSADGGGSSFWSKLGLGALGLAGKVAKDRLEGGSKSGGGLGSTIYNDLSSIPGGEQLQRGLSDLGLAPQQATSDQGEESTGSKLLKYGAIAAVAYVGIKALRKAG